MMPIATPEAEISADWFFAVFVAEQCILQQKCLKKWIGSTVLGTRWCNFQHLTPTLSPTMLLHNVTDRQTDRRQDSTMPIADHTVYLFSSMRDFCNAWSVLSGCWYCIVFGYWILESRPKLLNLLLLFVPRMFLYFMVHLFAVTWYCWLEVGNGIRHALIPLKSFPWRLFGDNQLIRKWPLNRLNYFAVSRGCSRRIIVLNVTLQLAQAAIFVFLLSHKTQPFGDNFSKCGMIHSFNVLHSVETNCWRTSCYIILPDLKIKMNKIESMNNLPPRIELRIWTLFRSLLQQQHSNQNCAVACLIYQRCHIHDHVLKRLNLQ